MGTPLVYYLSFYFSLIALPLFLYLRQNPNQELLSKLARFLEKPGAIFLLALPLAIIEGFLRPKWHGFQNLYNDWANFFLYIFYFIYGYLIADARFGQAIDKHLKVSVIMAITSMSLLFGLWANDILPNRATQ